MADPYGIAKDIVKTGLAIKEALETARQNEEECQELQVLVATVSAVLSRLKEVKLTIDPTTYVALELINASLGRALKIVNDFQRRKGLRRFVTAGDMAKKLRQVNDDILRKMQVGNFAITASMVAITIEFTKTTIVPYDGAHPLPTQPQDAVKLDMYNSNSNNGFSMSKTVTTHQFSEGDNKKYQIIKEKIRLALLVQKAAIFYSDGHDEKAELSRSIGQRPCNTTSGPAPLPLLIEHTDNPARAHTDHGSGRLPAAARRARMMMQRVRVEARVLGWLLPCALCALLQRARGVGLLVPCALLLLAALWALR